MEGNSSEPEIIHGEVDIISKLPDDIIYVILDFLPLKEAIRTGILSSRWEHLWKHTHVLNFDTRIYKFDSPIRREMRKMESTASSWNPERSKYIQLVNSVLQSHKSPSLERFTISFYVNKSAQSLVIEWLEYVFLRGVERLEADFVCNELAYMVVLEELLRESGLCRPQNLRSLKKLCLKSFIVSGEAVKLILCHCPSLEELAISRVFFTSDVEVCGPKLALKRLDVYANEGGISLKVSAPNLTWISVDNTLKKLSLENLPKLVGAGFELGMLGGLKSAQSLVSALFSFTSQLEVLSLSLFKPEWILTNPIPQMPNLKKLVLEHYGAATNSLLPVTALMWASPSLEEFKLVVVQKGNAAASIQVARDEGERSPHQNLKVFEFGGLRGGASRHIELLTYISENSVALRKLIIAPCADRISWLKLDAEYEAEVQSAWDYTKQQLLGKLPQHVQLQLRRCR